MSRRSSKFRLAALALVALLPSFLKRPAYRLCFGYKIGKRVRVGLSIIDAEACEIGDDVRVGHFNVFTGVKELTVGEHARVGHLNVIRGGDEVRIGRWAEIIRLNEINSIPDPLSSTRSSRSSSSATAASSPPATRSTSPTASRSGGAPSSAGATLPCGRTTASARAPS